MNWLITGGCGFIGSNVIRAIAASSERPGLRVLDNLCNGEAARQTLPDYFRDVPARDLPALSAGMAQFVHGDIRDLESVMCAAQGADVIIHLAAATGVLPSIDDPLTDCKTNVLGTLNCLEAARAAGCARFIFASSGAALGEQDPPLHEGILPRPISPYGAGKLAGEAYCDAFRRSYGLVIFVLRFSNVYGPGSAWKNSVVAKFIKDALSGRALSIYGDGAQTRDFVYIDDLAAAVLCAAQSSSAEGQVLQVASGQETSVSVLVGLLQTILRNTANIDAKVVHVPPQKGEVVRNFACIDRVRQVLGWTPTVELADGLARTVDWFLAQ